MPLFVDIFFPYTNLFPSIYNFPPRPAADADLINTDLGVDGLSPSSTNGWLDIRPIMIQMKEEGKNKEEKRELQNILHYF